MPAPLKPVLEVRDLNIDLVSENGAIRPIVSDVSFDLAPGTVVGLFGDSGCGKTTLALGLMRLLTPKRYRIRGEVFLEGRDVLALDSRELERIRGARISMIFQDPLLALNPVRRVGWQVEEVLRAHGAEASAESLLETVGLPAGRRTLDSYPHQLSGGERQRVVIAQALACRPAVVIADEPLTALDVIRVLELARLFRELTVKTGAAFLLITHTPGVLSAIADSVLAMRAGRIVGRPAPREVVRYAR